MLESQKNLFSLREGQHYLNCAFKAPLLKEAEEQAIKALIKQRNPSELIPDDYFNEAEEVRQLFGELVNCKASEVAIIPSSSYGFSSVLNNIPARQRQEVISIENDFPSDYFSIQAWCAKNDTVLKVIRSNPTLHQQGRDWNNNIIESINENTAIVILSSIHWMSGLKFNLKQIGAKCKEVGAKFIVDGTQSVGALPMDVQEYNIDALVCATYKWLFGPYSIALAYIGPAFNEGTPLEESWMNRTNSKDFSNLTNYDPNYKPDAGRYNVGQFSNFILMPILIVALKQIKKWRVEEIQNYSKQLIQPLINYFNKEGIILEEEEYFSNHLFSLPLTNEFNMNKLSKLLKEQGIILSVRSGKLRVSVNVFNTSEDIMALLNAIKSSKN